MDGHIDGEGSARDRHALVQHAAHSRNHTAHSTKQHINAAHGFQRAACSHQCANHARYFQKQKKTNVKGFFSIQSKCFNLVRVFRLYFFSNVFRNWGPLNIHYLRAVVLQYKKNNVIFLSCKRSPGKKHPGDQGGEGQQKKNVEKSGVTMEPTGGRRHGRRANFHRGATGIS